MDPHLQLCTVSLVATVLWPVCWLCGASTQWQAFHFGFAAVAWVITGGFALALAAGDLMDRKLAEWALLPAHQSPLAWVLLVVFITVAIGATMWLMWPEWLLRREIMRRGASAILDHGRAGVDP